MTIPTPCVQCGAPPGEPEGWSKVVLVASAYTSDAPIIPFVVVDGPHEYFFDKEDCRVAWLGKLTG